MRRPIRSPRAKAVVDAEAKAQMMRHLYSCTPQRLAELTVNSLTGLYRVERREAEYQLTIARQKRAGELG